VETKSFPFYPIFRLFARPEAYLFYSYLKLNVVGAEPYFLFAAVVGEDRHTVVMDVGFLADTILTGNPKGGIVILKRGK